MPTKNVRFAISQFNSTVSALTAVRSQSTSTGLISRRQFSEIRLVAAEAEQWRLARVLDRLLP
jgi:hypothetical protein